MSPLYYESSSTQTKAVDVTALNKEFLVLLLQVSHVLLI